VAGVKARVRFLVFSALGAGLCSCGGGGRLDLVLDLPDTESLRPAGMTTVTVVAQPFEADPVETTSVLSGSSFQAGDLPAGEPVAIAVELRDGTGRMVGYGRAPDPIELSVDEATTQRIFVRRPFLYAASPAGMFTFDPTRDSLDPAYQGRLTAAGQLRALPLGGDELAVVRAGAVDVFSTEDHQATGTSISIGTPNDAAPVPGARTIILGLDSGFAIVDLDGGSVVPVAGPAVARVTVGLTADGRTIVYGLVGRVAPSEIDEPCPTTTSQIASFDLAAPEAVTTDDVALGLADIAAGIDAPALVGAAPCDGSVVSIDTDGEAGLVELAPLERAALVAMQGTRVWAVGTQAAKLQYDGATIDYVDDDAITLVISTDIRGGSAPLEFALPRRRETMIDMDDPAREHAQVMKPMSALPIDMVVLAGGEFVAVTTRYKFHSSALVSGTLIVLPVMDATTADVVLIDGATTTLAQRVRSECLLVTGNADFFPNWECGDADEAETPKLGQFEAVALGALYGDR
jgi:hypothetical protein